MMAFFLTMPISKITPISPMMSNSVLKEHQRQQGADACGRQCREDSDRVDVALVQHAEENVDGGKAPQGSGSAPCTSAC